MKRVEVTVNEPFGVECVAGVPFQVATMQETIEWLLETAAPNHLAVNIRLANAWNVALAHDDAEYMDLLANQGVNLPDGAPVVWFMNAQRRGPLMTPAGRVRGPSFFTETMSQSAFSNIRHFLLGGSQQTLDALVANLSRSNPETQIVGAYSPPFAPVTEEYISDCAERISASRPDVVWIGLGTPKQDRVGTALAELLMIPTVNVGAAFDFAGGTAREAPPWIQKSGFEWLFRLATEPRRLWVRYTYGNARFLCVAIAAQIGNKRLRRAPSSENTSAEQIRSGSVLNETSQIGEQAATECEEAQ